MRRLLILTACLAAAACSRHEASQIKTDTAQIGQGAKALGHDVADDVRDVGHSPELKDAGDQMKTAANDLGQHTKQAAHDVHNAVDQ